jgi:hypothetical protein
MNTLEKSPKQSLFLSMLSVICLLLSLVIFYPLSMKADKYSNAMLAISAYLFYIFQAVSLGLAIVAFARCISAKKSNISFQNYFPLIISVIVFAVFGYEVFWFLQHV